MDNLLDAALSGEEPVVTPEPDAPPPEAQTPEAMQQELQRERDAQGRFTAKAETPEEPKPEPGHVPLTAMLDEREKRQAAEKALKEFQANLERQRAEWQAQQPEPDPADRLAAQRYADNLRYSRKFAERAHGAEVIAKVHDWASARCDADPFFNEQMRASDDPYEAAHQAWQRDQIASQVSMSDLEEFNAWKAAQAAARADPQTPAAKAAPPPRSLAEVSGTGALGNAAVNVGEGEAFASLFRKN